MNMPERKELAKEVINVESYIPGFGLVTSSVAGPHIACLTVWTDFTV